MQEEEMGNVQSSQAGGTTAGPQSVGPNAITNPLTPLLLLAAPSIDTQPWRIRGTLDADHEERRINRLVDSPADHADRNQHIVCYGLNSTDESPVAQAVKLARHGLVASVYRGGLLEWSLFRDVFGNATYGIDNVGADREAECNTLDFLPRG